MRRYVVFLLLTAQATIASCGDDDGTSTDGGLDGGGDGSVDLGRDSDAPDATDASHRRDLGPDQGVGPDPEMRDCDPADDPCPEGQKCALVVQERPGDDPLYFTRCVPAGSRSLGARCSFSVELPGGTTATADTCVRGAFCGTDAEHRFPSCLPYCGSGRDCSGGSLCLGVAAGTAARVCLSFDRCDPAYQVGCPAGEGCYVVADDTRSATTCTTFVPDDVTGGEGTYLEPCTYVNNCEPGLMCVVDLGPDGRPTTTRHCRPFCDVTGAGRGGTGGGGLDAGSDAATDAGDASAGAEAGSDGGTATDGAPLDATGDAGGDAGASLDGAPGPDGDVEGGPAEAGGPDGGPADTGAPGDAGPADAGTPGTGRCPEGTGLCLPLLLGIAEEPPPPLGICRE